VKGVFHSWFPNSVWEPIFAKLRFASPLQCQRGRRETEFRGRRSQTEFGNEKKTRDASGGRTSQRGGAPPRTKNSWHLSFYFCRRSNDRTGKVVVVRPNKHDFRCRIAVFALDGVR